MMDKFLETFSAKVVQRVLIETEHYFNGASNDSTHEKFSQSPGDRGLEHFCAKLASKIVKCGIDGYHGELIGKKPKRTNTDEVSIDVGTDQLSPPLECERKNKTEQYIMLEPGHLACVDLGYCNVEKFHFTIYYFLLSTLKFPTDVTSYL